jgi:hypothetical protein
LISDAGLVKSDGTTLKNNTIVSLEPSKEDYSWQES